MRVEDRLLNRGLERARMLYGDRADNTLRATWSGFYSTVLRPIAYIFLHILLIMVYETILDSLAEA